MPYNPQTQLLRDLRRPIGVGNAGGFKPRIYMCFMEELLYGDKLPAYDSRTFNISANIAFRAAIPSVSGSEPVPAGGCVEIEISDEKSEFSGGEKTEHFYTNYEPTFKCYIARTNPLSDFVLFAANGGILCLFFQDNNGFMRVGVNAQLSVKSKIVKGENGYELEFKFGILANPLPTYTGAIVMRQQTA